MYAFFELSLHKNNLQTKNCARHINEHHFISVPIADWMVDIRQAGNQLDKITNRFKVTAKIIRFSKRN